MMPMLGYVSDNRCLVVEFCEPKSEEAGSVHVSFQEPLKCFVKNLSSEQGIALVSV